MVLSEQEYNYVWEKVYNELGFHPSVYEDIVPFSVSMPYVVYDISKTASKSIEDSDALITEAFIACTNSGELMYALDWQHAGFLFDPRDLTPPMCEFVEEPRFDNGGYYAVFPSYYPDGDYYFFIDRQFRFGYLSHPWREEVWIFGEELISAFDKIYTRLGWSKDPMTSCL